MAKFICELHFNNNISVFITMTEPFRLIATSLSIECVFLLRN